MTDLAARPDGITPSQTVGPFFAYVLTPRDYDTRPVFSADIATPDAVGTPIRLEGYVIDGNGEPIPDAMIEIWQADGEGRYAGAPGAGDRPNAAFKGFGRSDLDANGFFSFSTVMPGSVEGPNGRRQAPHISITIFARGLLKHLITRAYFESEALNDEDPILGLVPEERRHTLIAKRQERGDKIVYTINLRLQGDDETVFFEA